MPPELPQCQGRSRRKIEGGNGIEEVDIQKDDEDPDDSLHYLLRRVWRRLVFRDSRVRVFLRRRPPWK